TSSTPAAVTSCTDSGLAAGSHDYTVTAKWRTWTATSGTTTIPVASGAPDHFVLAAASTTPAAGAAHDLTITAEDSGGNTVSAFVGSHDLTFGGASTIGALHPTVTDKDGVAVDFGSTTPITFSAGVATVSSGANGVMKLYKAESATVTVTAGTLSGSLGVTVAAGAASQVVLSGATSNLASGATRTFTATVEDTAGNTITSGADSSASVNFGQTGGTGSVTGTGSATAAGG